MTERMLDELFIGAPSDGGYASGMPAWTPDQLSAVAASRELEISTLRSDGTWRDYLPIWTVTAESQVFVRTWYRRETGWFGRAVLSGRARIRVPGVQTEVRVADVGAGELRDEVDAAYRAKYGAGTGRMVGDEAAGTTLRLDPVS